MSLHTTSIDELIDLRIVARKGRNYPLSDEIRMYLDAQLVFIFDTAWGQEIYYLTQKYFMRKPDNMTHRQYVEFKIKEDIRIEAIFQAWLYTTKHTS